MYKRMKDIKEEKGITLLALVVTIIVLLILAFIAISVLMGDDGIVKKAEESREETIKAQEREFIKLAYQDLEIEYRLNGTDITADRVMEKLSEYDKNIKVEMITKDEIGDTEIVVEKNSGEEYAEIIYTETEHKYAGSLVIDENKARYEVTYNANRGYGGPSKQVKIEGTPLIITSEMPERKGYNFIGWATESTAVVAEYLSGSQYTKDENITLYAVWQLRTDIEYVAQIGNTKYPSIQDAVYDCSQEAGEEKTTIIVLKNTEEEFTTFEGQNIILDLKGYTVTSESEGALCTNNGKLQIINGSLSSNKGTSILNNGEITIGDNSTGIDDNTPTIYGNKVGVDNKGTFNYYDGKIQGIVPIQGTTTSTPDQYGPVQTGYENGISTIQLRILTQYEARIGWVYYEKLQGAIDIAKAKETVTLIKNLQLTEILQVGETKDVILDLYGYELTVASGLDTVIKNYGDLEITDNSIEQTGNIVIITSSSDCYGIRNEGEKALKIAGGTVSSNSGDSNSHGIYNASSGSIEVTGGNINSKGYSFYGIYNASSGNVSMIEGYINCDGKFYGYGIYNLNEGNIIVTGGEIYCKAVVSYGICNSNNGDLSVKNMTINCERANYSNGGRGYGIYNSEDGNLTLENVEIKCNNLDIYGIYNNYGEITIINSKIDGKSTGSGSSGHYGYGIYNIKGKINIEDSIIKNTALDNSLVIYNDEDGQIEISNSEIESYLSVTYSDNNYGIFNNGNGLINIINGTIKSIGYYVSYGIYNRGVGKIIIGSLEKEISQNEPCIIGEVTSNSYYKSTGIYNNEGIIEFYNGIIQGDVPLTGNITKIREGYLIEESTIEEKNSIYLVEKLKEEILKIDETKYHSLQEAIDSIGENEEKIIEVLKDFEINEAIKFNKNVILDLKGYTIINKYYKIENTSNLTITDTSEETQGKIETINTMYGISNKDKGNIIIEGGIISSSNKWESYGIYNESTGNIVVEEGTVSSSSDSSGYSYGIYNASTGSIVVEKGTASSSSDSSGYSYGIYNASTGSIVVEEGTVSSNSSSNSNNYGIYNASSGSVTVKAGTISNSSKWYNYGIYNASTGSIVVEEGTVSSSGRYSYGIYNATNGNVTVKAGTVKAGTVSSSDSRSYGIYNRSTGSVTITGGTVSGSRYGIYNASSGIVEVTKGTIYGIYNWSIGTIKIGIKGDGIISQEEPMVSGYEEYGIYNTTGKLYFYDGKIEGGIKAVYETITEKEENTYLNYNEDETILTLSTEKIPIAQIGDITYTDLQEAVEAVTEDNNTIKIIRNITYTNENNMIVVQNTKNVTIDLNGYKITSAIQGKTIQNEGQLEITDTSETKTGRITTSEETTIYNVSGAKLTISEGAIENKLKYVIYNEGEIIVEEGTVSSSSYSDSYGIYNASTGCVIVEGGTVSSSGINSNGIYNSSTGSVIVEGGTVSSSNTNSKGIYNASTGSVIVKGGSVNSSGCGIYNANSGIVEIAKGIVGSNFIGGTGIYNASTGSVIVKEGTVSSSSYSDSYGIYNASTGCVIVEGGTVSSSNRSSIAYGIYNNSTGTITVGIKGDRTVSQEEPIIRGTKTSTSSSNYKGYGIYNPKGTLYYYDGKIQGTDKAISGNITEIEDSTEINLSEETVDSKVYKTMILNQVTTNVAKVNGTEYDSIQKAVETCGETESTIEILRDSNQGLAIIIEENQNITIDLKGYTINNYTELQNKGILKIIDSSAEQTGKIIGLTGIAISNTGTLEVQGGAISDSGYGMRNTGTLTLNGGKVTGNTYGIYNNSNGVINIEQGNISSNTYGIYNYSSSSITNINEGTITSNEYGIYNYNGTTNIITKGITSNTYGVYVANGTVTAKEGAEIQSETGIYVSSGTLNIGETGTMNPESPIITGETYGLTVSATGKVYMYDGQVKGKTGATEGYITYTEEGYVVANKTEGEYFIDYLALGGTANAVAQVNGVSYSNLQSAINSITGEEEQTIILLNGIVSTETYTITEGQNIILDMNGKTITSEAEETINNAGSLTIIDTSGKNVAKITSTTGTAIVNSGTLTLGEDEGTVTEELITIEGSTYGIENIGMLNIYDGAVIGTTAIEGEVEGTPSGYTITTSTVSGKEKATLTQ